MASRLDKLFELLESNNPSIRSAAAVQIGKISINSQVEISSLLNKLLPYITHKTWSVRIAAADAVKCITVNAKLLVSNVSNISTEEIVDDIRDMISLEKLNLVEILKVGTRLYSTDIRELDESNIDSTSNTSEISRHLGFIIPEEMEIKSILTKEDFEFHKSTEENKLSVAKAVEHSMGSDVKSRKRTLDCLDDTDATPPKTRRTPGNCPWQVLWNELLVALWHPRWETRHGAATALRELVRGENTLVRGVQDGTGRQQDAMARLLCTLALDQLSDFVSDEMVAPVRESCAQALGLLSVRATPLVVELLVERLLSLLCHERGGRSRDWTASHGALLGLKYVLATRRDLASRLVPQVLPSLQASLRDPNGDDDVRCAAAAALLPVLGCASALSIDNNYSINDDGDTAFSISTALLAHLRADLWALLALKPDASGGGAVAAVLQLLDKLYCQERERPDSERGEKICEKQFNTIINRLHWCYFSYSEAVRLAAVRTCASVLKFYDKQLDKIPQTCLSQVMSQIFQRVLIDDNSQVLSETENLWLWIVNSFACDILAQSNFEKLDVWMCLAMQPARLSYASGVILLPEIDSGNEEDYKHQFPKEFFIGGRESFFSEGSSIAREEAVLQARLSACRLLANLCRKFGTIHPLAEHILITILAQTHLKERLAVQRFVAAMILAYWNPDRDWVVSETNQILAPLRLQLLTAIEEPIYYQELLPAFRQMVKTCRDLQACYRDLGIEYPSNGNVTNLNLSQCQQLVSSDLLSRLGEESNINKFSIAKTSVDVCARQHTELSRLVEVSLGRALLSWGWLPNLLTPLIKPLMDAIRSEERLSVQNEAASALSRLVLDHISSIRLAPSISKLVRNLIQYLSDSIDVLSPNSGEIISLQKTTQLGRDALPHQEELPANFNINPNDLTFNSSLIKLRGSRLALEKICDSLFSSDNQSDNQSTLLQLIYHQPIDLLTNPNSRSTSAGQIISSLRAMVTCLPSLSSRGDSVDLTQFADCVFSHGLSHEDVAVRHWSARVLVSLASPSNNRNIELCRLIIDRYVLGGIVDALNSASSNEYLIQGAIELVHLCSQLHPLSTRLALVNALLPLSLRCLNAPLEAVRKCSTHAFSQLLVLLPLEQSSADLTVLLERRRQERLSNLEFLRGLQHPDSISIDQSLKLIDSLVTAELRVYQRQGVSWLSFLRRYGLHGVLADDMGLGKTLQALCAVAEAHTNEEGRSASLIVCPATLTAHWQREARRHFTNKLPLSVTVYSGPADTRANLLDSLCRDEHQHAIIITSYDILRNDLERLIRPPVLAMGEERSPAWLYVILDEGHLIRNHRSKLAQAARAVSGRHRLVLTGTPIQNRTAELWSLFEFLMPGLLGSHSDFHRRFGKLLDPRRAVGSGGEGDAGTRAGTLDRLHRLVLPFILRRVKEDVLSELPPKLMQDYVCTMTPLQSRLYVSALHCLQDNDDENIESSFDNLETSSEGRRTAFQAMHYLRLVVNHPTLALCPTHPLYQSVMRELATNNQRLDDTRLSGKLVALKQLILDCGIGTVTNGNSNGNSIGGVDDSAGGLADLISSSDGATVVANHRLLIFCQSKAMLALVENMISNEIPKASHLRLDGSVPIKDRQQIVDRFNQDASIDMLLLTTSIGGLGLNLTSADVVIFVEHDWNPMRDLQAMDRAHRIGQRRVVNVYRLITADSIEEKIMNLQKFKLFIANTVVGSDNKQMESMNTDCLLDIMDKDSQSSQGNSDNRAPSTSGVTKTGGLKSMLNRLDNVYDTLDEYNDEYNLENFVQNL